MQGGGGFNVVDLGEDVDSSSQFAAFGGLGAKVPAGDQFAVRLEGNLLRAFETDDRFGYWGIQGVIGFSFFTQ